MAWKMFSDDYSASCKSSNYSEPKATPKPRQIGTVIASVGKKSSLEINVENVFRIGNDILGYNLDSKRVLLRVPQNDRDFDVYVTLPFTKGVTERESGRTMLIVRSGLHHIQAMGGSFRE